MGRQAHRYIAVCFIYIIHQFCHPKSRFFPKVKFTMKEKYFESVQNIKTATTAQQYTLIRKYDIYICTYTYEV